MGDAACVYSVLRVCLPICLAGPVLVRARGPMLGQAGGSNRRGVSCSCPYSVLALTFVNYGTINTHAIIILIKIFAIAIQLGYILYITVIADIAEISLATTVKGTD